MGNPPPVDAVLHPRFGQDTGGDLPLVVLRRFILGCHPEGGSRLLTHYPGGGLVPMGRRFDNPEPLW